MSNLDVAILRRFMGESPANTEIDQLFSALYQDLRQLARRRLQRSEKITLLDTTALVHESYLRFVSAGELRAEDRRAFFAFASQVMRSVIVNSVRAAEAGAQAIHSSGARVSAG